VVVVVVEVTVTLVGNEEDGIVGAW